MQKKSFMVLFKNFALYQIYYNKEHHTYTNIFYQFFPKKYFIVPNFSITQ